MPGNLRTEGQALNATMRKFGAPETCLRAYQHWSVLLRPAQVTLGAMILAAHDSATAFSQLSPASFTELRQVIIDVETALSEAFKYDKINYLMLMMVDRDVHFHVLPRYGKPRKFEGREFVDFGWPGPPDLGRINETGASINNQIMSRFRSCWP